MTSYRYTGTAGSPGQVYFNMARGRYLLIMLNNTNWLSLAEVRVWGS